MDDKCRNSDLVECGVDEYADTPKPKGRPKKTVEAPKETIVPEGEASEEGKAE